MPIQEFDILNFGARGDGVTLNTVAIQSAVDACHAVGGGQVYCGPGVFLTGTVELKSRVELHVSSGCRLLGSPRLADYRDLRAKGFRHELAPERSAWSLLQGIRAENIAITGSGTIDGAGLAFYDPSRTSGKFDKPQTARPRIGMFFQCRNLRIQDVAFVDSPCWTLWLMQCEDLWIQRITIDGNRRMRNVDGIDLDACRNAVVSDCRIHTEDDCLVLRAIQGVYESPAICENITVTNCLLDSGCQGVRIGCPGDGAIRACTLSNLVIHSAGNGIVFDNPKRYLAEGRSGSAHVSNLLFANVSIDCVRNPIRMTVEDGIALPRLADVSFADFRIRSGLPCLIEGNPQTIIENLRFSNMTVETSGEDAIRCRYCRNVQLQNVVLSNQTGE